GDALHFYNENYSWANSIFLSGSDVYVTGFAFDTLSYVYAAYWKNGSATYLNGNFTNALPLTQQSRATSIMVPPLV
ncbi:MAG: hypothetical protein P4L51_04550, partial [Puia sp.]|nr:hypothetical protein [Puia sp.]